MSSIHDSSIRYLFDLAKGLEEGTCPDLLKKINNVKTSQRLDSETVELAEKVIDFIGQAYRAQQQDHTNPNINYERLSEIDCPKLREKLAPLIKEALSFAPSEAIDPSLAKKVAKVSKLLNEPLQAPAKGWKSTLWDAATYVKDTALYLGADLGGAIGGIQVLEGAGSERINQKCEEFKGQLFEKTKSPVVAQMASVTSKRVCEYLSDTVLKAHEKEPIIRPGFLKGNIFTDESAYTTKPELTATGKVVADLLQETPREFEKIIEVNLLKASTNIVDFLDKLQKPEPEGQPFFLVQLCHTCLQDILRQHGNEKISTVELMQQFSKTSTELIFELAFPGGKNDLILPDGLLESTLVNKILPNVPLVGVDVRQELWTLVADVVKDQIGTFLEGLQGKEDLKNMLLIEGYSTLLPIISTAPTKKGGVVQRAAEVPFVAGTLSLAPVGFVYIFLKLLLTSIIGVFQHGKPKVTGENPYKHQESFNTDLKLLIESIIEDTDSMLLKAFSSHKLKSLIDDFGPVIVEAIREVKFIDIFNAQCENVVSSVISPGGTWVGEGNDKHYEPKPQAVAKTQAEKAAKEKTEKEQEAARAVQVEELQQQFGNKIDGLIHIISKSLEVEHKDLTEEELKTASVAQKLSKKIHKAWASFANAIIYRLVKLCSFVLNGPGKVRTTARAFHGKIKKVRQEDFVLSVGEFAQKEFVTRAYKARHS